MITDTLGIAFDRARAICVERVTLTRWLVLAVASWLAYLGTSQSNTTFNVPNYANNLGNIDPTVAIVIVAVVAVIGTAIWLLVTWLRSRGQLLLVNLVARDGEDLVDAWNRTSALGNELFRVRLGMDFVGGVLTGLCVGAGVLGSWAIGASIVPSGLWWPVGVGGAVAAAISLVWAVATFVLDELVVPLAWARQARLGAAFAGLRTLAEGDGGRFVAYLGVRLLAAIVVAILAGALSCMLCMIAWLPFVSALFLLPFRVYLQSLPLAFLHRVDPETCAAFAPLPAPGAGSGV